MKNILIKFTNYLKSLKNTDWLKILIIFTLSLILIIAVIFNFKIRNLRKENLELLKQKEDKILELENYILDIKDYQKIKTNYEKIKTDTTRIISNDRLDELFSKHYR